MGSLEVENCDVIMSEKQKDYLGLNIAFYGRLNQVVKENGSRQAFYSKVVRFIDPSDPGYIVDITCADFKEALKQDSKFGLLPTPMKTTPIIALREWHSKSAVKIGTSYGDLPNMIIGKDNRLYLLNSWYFVNWQGKAIRVETASCSQKEATEENLRKWRFPSQIEKVGFVPNKRPHHSQLNQGDRDRISEILAAIECNMLKVEVLH